MRSIIESILRLPSQELIESLTAFMSSKGRETLPELSRLAPDIIVTVRRLHKDNLDHSIRVCAQTPNSGSLRLRWAALYHDVGKALTRQIDGNGVTFQGHETVGARLTTKRLRSLGYSESFVQEVATLVEISGRISSFDGSSWTDSAVRRLAKDLNDDQSLINDALDLVRADCTSKHQKNRDAAKARADGFAKKLEEIRWQDSEAARRPPIDGIAVMRILNLKPSKDVAVALRWLLENHETSSPDVAEEALKNWWYER